MIPAIREVNLLFCKGQRKYLIPELKKCRVEYGWVNDRLLITKVDNLATNVYIRERRSVTTRTGDRTPFGERDPLHLDEVDAYITWYIQYEISEGNKIGPCSSITNWCRAIQKRSYDIEYLVVYCTVEGRMEDSCELVDFQPPEFPKLIELFLTHIIPGASLKPMVLTGLGIHTFEEELVGLMVDRLPERDFQELVDTVVKVPNEKEIDWKRRLLFASDRHRQEYEKVLAVEYTTPEVDID